MRPFSPTRVPSPPSSPDHDHDLDLPPNPTSSQLFLDGETPSVLADHALHLHSHGDGSASRHRRPGGVARQLSFEPASQSQNASLLGVLSGEEARTSKGSANPDGVAGERQPLLSDSNAEEDESDDEEDDSGPVTWRRRRGSRSRSKSMNRKLKWYQRPSPYWFLPGTMLMALSIGMIISPKMEIYTQLVCRAMPISDLPASQSGIGQLFFLNSPVTSQASAWEGAGTGSAEEDQEWAKQCRSRPEVQQAVVPLATTLTLSGGLLSALTTGYWGALSDRRGRKPIIALSLFGMLFMDVVFLVVVNYHNVVGYRFLLVGPAVDGLLGGFATAQAATYAYLSDCTDAGSRARLFSILGGLLFGGIAVGPTLGSFLISMSPSPTAVIRPFYVALLMHTLYFLLVVLLVPESLSLSRQMKARERWAAEKASRGGWRPWSFLRPLALLLPLRKGQAEEMLDEDRPILWSAKRDGGRDAGEREVRWRRWSLFKITLGFSLYMLIVSAGMIKIQYTQYKYGWDSIRNGWYLSFAGFSRMIVLIAILPGAIWLFRKPPPLPSWGKPPMPDDDADATEEQFNLYEKWEKEARYLRVTHDSHFDLSLARLSVFIDFISYLLISFPNPTPPVFVLATFVQGLGGGAQPALQSLALAHASPRDAGRLFASLSVLSALCTSVLGPFIFGLVYFATLKTWPEAIFAIATMSYALSFGALMLVKLGGKAGEKDETGQRGLDGQRSALERGRSETRKPGTLSSDIVLRN